jgi:hypothetical protein
VTQIIKNDTVEAKQAWVRPALQRIDAGSAESNETGAQTDSSSPQRS